MNCVSERDDHHLLKPVNGHTNGINDNIKNINNNIKSINSNSSLDLLHDISRLKIDIPEEKGWKKLLAYLGPGFLVSIAYIDPGNFESDLQAGARFKYELLWVLLLASFGGLIIQSLSANLGVVTGQHLAQHCRSEYPKNVNFVLWVMAELTIIASDIPEVIGTAFAINMLFGLEVWVGVLITSLSTFLLLAIQHYGVRKLEVFISVLVLLIALCFLIEVGFAKPNVSELLLGLVTPKLEGTHATAIAISLVGSVVMPHNLFLHSALVLSRKTTRTHKSIKDGCFFNLIEVSFALLIAFIINISVIAVSGAVCNEHSLSELDRLRCTDLDLNKAPFLLKHTLGPGASTLFAIALLASGQSSTITGTYAGQYVMEGFLEMKYQPWIRNMVTRSVAILPSLFISLIAGAKGAGKLIILSSMILSFELPFALIPLLKFTSSEMKMGPYANSIYITVLAWILGLFVIIVNVYFLFDITFQWLLSSPFHLATRVFIGIFILISILIYISFVVYLAFRRDSNFTYAPVNDFSITEEEEDDPFHDITVYVNAEKDMGDSNDNAFRVFELSKLQSSLKVQSSSKVQGDDFVFSDDDDNENDENGGDHGGDGEKGIEDVSLVAEDRREIRDTNDLDEGMLIMQHPHHRHHPHRHHGLGNGSL